MMTGNVFSIEEFSVYDGPGIRTTVFLKGCPLRCSWCHNPEGQNPQSEIVKSPNGCISCGNCLKNSVEINGRTVLTEESIKSCPMNLIRICGNSIESEQLCRKLLKNERILKNGGGVTFSGGEPFLQAEFMFECLEILKNRLHTAIQTSGYCSEKHFKKSMELTDFFLFDLKIIDDNLHKLYTGVSNRQIIENFKVLAQSDKEFVVRTPLIPGITDTEQNFENIAKLLNDYNVHYIELLPYNKMAGGKYKMLMREFNPAFDETREVNIHKKILDSFNIEFKIM